MVTRISAHFGWRGVVAFAGAGRGVSVLPFWGGGGGGGGGLGLLMAEFSKDKALVAHWDASLAVRQVMTEEAQVALGARQASMIALEQRISQAAAALFAAAALSAAFAGSARVPGLPLMQLGALATIFFILGALICLKGMTAGDIVFPGASPSWWKGFELDADDPERHARNCVAVLLEQAIESYDAVSNRRADLLNLGLKWGSWGGIWLLVAATLMIFASAPIR